MVVRTYGGEVVGGGNDDTVPAPARAGRSRPHWWAVLAVALALMALLAAATSGHPARDAAGRPQGRGSGGTSTTALPPVHSTAHRAASDRAAVPSVPTTAPGGNPGSDEAGTTVSTVLSVDTVRAPSGSSASGRATGSTREGAATSTTEPTPTTTSTTEPSAAAAPDEAAAGVPAAHGSLSSPAFASPTIGFVVDTQTAVVATWSPSALVTLTVTCPSGTQTAYGTSSATVDVPDLTGTCEAALTENSAQPTAVAYTLSLETATAP